MPATQPPPTQAETIEKHIRRAWMAATASGSITLLVVIGSLAGVELFRGLGFNAWNLIDIAILFGLAFGVAKRSRVCALLLVIYSIANEVIVIAADQKPSPIRLFFIYFFIRGAVSTFKYQATRRPSTSAGPAVASPQQQESSLESQLRSLAALHADGLISEEEFTAKKRSLLGI